MFGTYVKAAASVLVPNTVAYGQTPLRNGRMLPEAMRICFELTATILARILSNWIVRGKRLEFEIKT